MIGVPARRPRREPIDGRTVLLEPLDAEHAPALYEAGRDPGDAKLWRFMPYGPWPERAGWDAWVADAARSEDPLFFAIRPVGGDPAGVASLMRITPEHGTIEIGHVWFGAALQRTPAATEAIYLLAREAFALGNRRLEWKCDARNARSRRAAERFGFSFEGVFGQHMVVKGANRDSAWFALLDGDWPQARAAFEAWMDPANFDAAGRQRCSLEELRA